MAKVAVRTFEDSDSVIVLALFKRITDLAPVAYVQNLVHLAVVCDVLLKCGAFFKFFKAWLDRIGCGVAAGGAVVRCVN